MNSKYFARHENEQTGDAGIEQLEYLYECEIAFESNTIDELLFVSSCE
jgi:hypothetical protein